MFKELIIPIIAFLFTIVLISIHSNDTSNITYSSSNDYFQYNKIVICPTKTF